MKNGSTALLGPRMGKKKKPPKETLYVEIDADLKKRIGESAEEEGRKLVAEVTRALEFYLAHKPKARPPAPPGVEGK